ncbi:MAG: DPP IV N-terminal domain-containing protein [Saprospiraceae bacterium]|nr:DPP IV N-terminal domain-containing protein [Saprospiraceae bacterium]
MNIKNIFKIIIATCFFFLSLNGVAQIKWATDGDAYFKLKDRQLIKYTLPNHDPQVVISKEQLTPNGKSEPISIDHYKFSEDQQKILLFTNTQKVWRLHTKGDYWVFNFENNSLRQIGKSLPTSSLMFAKFSPDGKSIAYVSENNLFFEDYATGEVQALTSNGSTTLINGTFDWAYEEEFACRDGFRWSPDSKSIAYWQIDASTIKKFYMINNTDSIYSQLIPLEYPKVGESPSACRVGVVQLSNKKTNWMDIPGDPANNYLVRMEYIPKSNQLLIQQLNRKQNHSKIYMADAITGQAKTIQEESDDAWVDLFQLGNRYAIDFTNNFIFLEKSKSILWASEKEGWRHLYQVSLEGKPEVAITKGDYDVIDVKHLDPEEEYVYYMASPDNATQKYLYRTQLNGNNKAELISPERLKGTHNYSFSTAGTYAEHTFTNYYTPMAREFIKVSNHKALTSEESILQNLEKLEGEKKVEFFKVKTAENIEMDGWMIKPKDFDPTKKYPVLFYVYTEPAGTTVNDVYNIGSSLYGGDLAADGYIYISIDNRGTPAPKGRAWRKSIYKKIGLINIDDQALATKEILKWDFVDPERIAVWGWSGGGSATLNLLFRYPEIYKTGISIAAVANQLTYDNIYQERYMGLPQENREDFIAGSPITYAKNLDGNLLYIHGTGDDNVHFQNAELLVNELIKYNKQFQYMPYPNRSHSMREGEGTFRHLSTLFTNFLRQYCPPGGK